MLHPLLNISSYYVSVNEISVLHVTATAKSAISDAWCDRGCPNRVRRGNRLCSWSVNRLLLSCSPRSPPPPSGAVGRAVSVEVDVSNRAARVHHRRRCPTAAVREARDRVRAAVALERTARPLRRVTVDLAPAVVMFGNHGATRAEGGRGRRRPGSED